MLRKYASRTSLHFPCHYSRSFLVSNLLEGCLDFKQSIDVKCWLETCCSSVWNRCDLTTVWTRYAEWSPLVMDYQWYQALLAVDMKVME
jgi:hypothetical protein